MTVQLMRGTLHKPDDPGIALYLCEMLAVVCVFVILALGRQADEYLLGSSRPLRGLV